jgi:hypothetical protein
MEVEGPCKRTKCPDKSPLSAIQTRADSVSCLRLANIGRKWFLGGRSPRRKLVGVLGWSSSSEEVRWPFARLAGFPSVVV